MPVQKSSLPINFAAGLSTKQDPKQVTPGKFLSLVNTVFNKQGLLEKRNGYGQLASLSDDTNIYLSTFNSNLVAVGSTLNAYSAGSNTWANKGILQRAELSVLSLLRSNTNQSQSDSVISANNFVCTAFTDDVPLHGSTTPTYKYVIADSITGQNIVGPTLIIPSTGTVAGAPKVFLLGRFFIIAFPVLVSASYRIQYIAVSTSNPTQITTAANITTQYAPSDGYAWEGVVENDTLYVAWNGSDTSVKVNFLSSTLALGSPKSFAGQVATHMSVAADSSDRNIYVSYYDSGSSNGHTLVLDASLNTVLSPTATITSTAVSNITQSVQNGVSTVFYEVVNAYAYDTDIATDYVNKLTVTRAGTVSSPSAVCRSVGLASKSFIIESKLYVVTIYSEPVGTSATQPTYFLMDEDGNVIVKLAYSNGGTYLTKGLPSVTVTGIKASFSYLIKDLLTSVNKTQGAANTAGIYSQTGINQASAIIGGTITSAEIGANLNLSGGILWAYDGFKPTEQGFHLWPDSVEASPVADPVIDGETTNGDPKIDEMLNTDGVAIGMTVSGTGIATGSKVVSRSATGVVMSLPATLDQPSATPFTFTGSMSAQEYFYQVTYEWSDNQGNIFRSAPSIPVSATTTSGHTSVELNIPTLRVTYKTDNPVKIVIYRWSTAQQTYYQVNSNQCPLLNDTSIDYVTYNDAASDADILGNMILYTTGGVVENIGPPAFSAVSLFKSRLFGIDSEEPNTLWFSKQIIPGTPVEMSDLLTYNAAPTIGSQGSTGPNRCLAPLDDKFIIFKKNAAYYFTGNGPDNTGANNDFSEPVYITATVGCENQRSIVIIPQGILFESDKGIWLLSRDLSTQYIGADVEAFTDNATVVSATNVPGTNQVRFTMSTGITLMYDYFYSQWGSFKNVPSIANTVYEDLDTYINTQGEVFQETPGKYLDGTRPVLISFLTGWLNLAGLQGFERAYFFYLLGQYITPHKLMIQIAYDYNPSPSQTTIITPDNFSEAWGGEQLWGSGQGWGGNSSTNVEQWRIFLQQQKCQAFQVSLQEAYDPAFGVPAGAGLTLSGMNLIVGVKDSKPKLRASRSAG